MATSLEDLLAEQQKPESFYMELDSEDSDSENDKDGKEFKEFREFKEDEFSMSSCLLSVPTPLKIEKLPDVLTEEYVLTPDEAGMTPLFRAIAQNDLDSVKKLLTIKGRAQLSEFEWACARTENLWGSGKPWMQRFDKDTKALYEFLWDILKKENLSVGPSSFRFYPLELFVAKKIGGWNDLIISILEGDVLSVEKILDESPEQLEQVDAYGVNPVLHAISERDSRIVARLMNLNSFGKLMMHSDKLLGDNGLSRAVVSFNSNATFIGTLFNGLPNAVIQKLMSNQGYNGKTPLMLACEMPNEEVVLRLIPHADLNNLLMKDGSGCCALFYAIWHGKVQAVQALLATHAKEQLLPIDLDIRRPVWEYVDGLSQQDTLKMTDSPYELSYTVTAQRKADFLKIGNIIWNAYKKFNIDSKNPVSKESKMDANYKGHDQSSALAFVFSDAAKNVSSKTSSNDKTRGTKRSREDRDGDTEYAKEKKGAIDTRHSTRVKHASVRARGYGGRFEKRDPNPLTSFNFNLGEEADVLPSSSKKHRSAP